MALGVRGTSPGPPNESRQGGRSALFLLNDFRLVVGDADRQLCPVGERLLALLALRGCLSRAVAAGTLWPDSPAARAHGSLRTTLWKLRGACPDLVEIQRERLRLSDGVEVDVAWFTGWARRLIEESPVAGDLNISATPCGDLLPGWYEDWVLGERERLRQLRLHALESLAVQLGREGRHAEAIVCALEAIQVEPLRESAHRILISLHLAEENVAEAVRHFRQFDELLRAALGIGPSPRLAALVSGRQAPRGRRSLMTCEPARRVGGSGAAG